MLRSSNESNNIIYIGKKRYIIIGKKKGQYTKKIEKVKPTLLAGRY